MKNKSIALLLFAAAFASCKKEKTMEQQDNRVVTGNQALSNVRIVNIGGYKQVFVNGKELTSVTERTQDDPNFGKDTGTFYFPQNGSLGSSWQVPQDLFGVDGSLEMRFTIPGAGIHNPELHLQGNQVLPMDYYLMFNGLIQGQPEYIAVERGVAQPSRPDHFKVRIINLCAKYQYPLTSPRGPLEDLIGPVTLAYADGTPVSPKTSNITLDTRVSDYVELPYGTYQFRVLTPDGRQFPGVTSAYTIDPPTSAIAKVSNYVINSTNITYAAIRTFQPGGVYTIVIAPYSFNYDASPFEVTGGAIQNAVRIITDVSPEANNTYSRLQGVNAFTGKQPTGLRVDGTNLATGISFGQASAYGNFVQGTHLIEAIDAAGNLLAKTEMVLRPAQNYSAWLYPTVSGQPTLVVVANDLSGTVFYDGGMTDDPSAIFVQPEFYFTHRYLNLSPDNPYITFTRNNGKLITEGINLQTGIPLLQQPYELGYYDQLPFELMAYRSAPNVAPGIWATDIPVLHGEDFIASKALYENAGRSLPAQEPGVYTVALIGSSAANADPADKARMIIIKHTK
jgi:hypothetical protein